MAEISWKQLSMIPESVLKAAVLKACGIEAPATGINRMFDGGTFQVFATVAPGVHYAEGMRYTLYQNGGTTSFDSHKEVLKMVKASPGTPTGDALRAFFQHYLPPTT